MHENILKWQLPVHAVIVVAILLLLNQIWPYFQRTIIKISTSDLDNNLGRIKPNLGEVSGEEQIVERKHSYLLYLPTFNTDLSQLDKQM